MPHYKDGTPAKIGDLVKRVGYNVKTPDGTPAVIVGTLVGIVPDSHACNVRVAHATVEILPEGFVFADTSLYHPNATMFVDGDGRKIAIRENYEYGQADQFELVHRP